MDQPTIYSETVRETVKGRLAFGVRRVAFGVWRSGENGSKPARRISRKNNTVGAPSFSPYRFTTHVTCSRCWLY
jgi:hypothetical protein